MQKTHNTAQNQAAKGKKQSVTRHQYAKPAASAPQTNDVLQRAQQQPQSLTPQDMMQLQRTIGNQAVGQLLSQTRGAQTPSPKPNHTGLPDHLKGGVESLSGVAMDDVKVHYNSDKPAQVQALAYTQGTDIHVAAGQERHLPHEAWHVVQQKQGQVAPTGQVGGMALNDDPGLEKEADVMGAKAMQMMPTPDRALITQVVQASAPVQRQHKLGEYQIIKDANLRQHKAPSYPVIRQLGKGEMVFVIDKGIKGSKFQAGLQENEHSWVQTQKGEEGWIEDSKLTWVGDKQPQKEPEKKPVNEVSPEKSNEELFQKQVGILVSLAQCLLGLKPATKLQNTQFEEQFKASEKVTLQDIQPLLQEIDPDQELAANIKIDSGSFIEMIKSDFMKAKMEIIGEMRANIAPEDWVAKIQGNDSFYGQFKLYFKNPAKKPSPKPKQTSLLSSLYD